MQRARKTLARWGAEAALPASSLDPCQQIFCNRSLNMANIGYVGFDMDYTLAQYKADTFEELVYQQTLKNLVHSVGYPEVVLGFKLDHAYMVRGLAIDKARGNVLKIDRHNYVKVAYHGWRELDSKERNETYNLAPFNLTFDEPNYALVDTLFAVGETYLFSQLVDLRDSRPELFTGEDGEKPKSYLEIYDDVREAVDLCHRDGSLKASVAEDPAKFIVDDETLVPLFKTLRESGRKVFLLTNSLYDYTDVVMTHLCRNYEGRWQDYFDTIVVGSRKPSFFKTSSPPFEVDVDTGMLRNTDNGESERLRARAYAATLATASPVRVRVALTRGGLRVPPPPPPPPTITTPPHLHLQRACDRVAAGPSGELGRARGNDSGCRGAQDARHPRRRRDEPALDARRAQRLGGAVRWRPYLRRHRAVKEGARLAHVPGHPRARGRD